MPADDYEFLTRREVEGTCGEVADVLDGAGSLSLLRELTRRRVERLPL
jgi:hypothetical protein